VLSQIQRPAAVGASIHGAAARMYMLERACEVEVIARE